jgi:SAM-dependent methyltransferase
LQNNKLTNQLFYKKSIDKYGISSKGVHWKDSYSQYIRFEVIYKLIKDDFTTSTIIDAGCGFGDFYNYILQNSLQCKDYIGIDSLDEMINLSQKRFPQIDFRVLDIIEDDLPQADYYIASGSLNILNKELFYLFIKRCFEVSKKGFVFNFLKKRSFNRLSIEEVLGYCSSLTSKIKTKNDYLDNDFTILMLK